MCVTNSILLATPEVQSCSLSFQKQEVEAQRELQLVGLTQ